MGPWPKDWNQADLPRLRDTPTTEQTIFVSPTPSRERYHTEHECPHVSSGFYVISPDDNRNRHYREKFKKCMWCKYDANDVLDLD